LNWLRVLGFVLVGVGIFLGLDYILDFGFRGLFLNFGLGKDLFQNTWDFILGVVFFIGGIMALEWTD
jgi:hypothetical protein